VIDKNELVTDEDVGDFVKRLEEQGKKELDEFIRDEQEEMARGSRTITSRDKDPH
jgi:hypothetical protein